MLDLVKAYEIFQHTTLKERLIEERFPLCLARWAVMIYGCPRVVVVAKACTEVFSLAASMDATP